MGNIINQPLNRFAYDLSDLNQLKSHVVRGSAGSIKQVAEQFESLFLNMMMQSMRKGVPEGGLFNQSSTQLFTAMFDQQVAQQAAGKGFGLADIIVKQLTTNKKVLSTMDVNSSAESNTNNSTTKQQDLRLAQSLYSSNVSSTSNLAPQMLGQMLYHSTSNNVEKTPHQTKELADKKKSVDNFEPDEISNFIEDWIEPAKQAAKASGIPYEVIIAQAALETGWGKKQIKTVDNQSSYNYFGIKANASWHGDSTRVTTQEFINDKMIKVQDDFRVYNSRQHALTDYLDLLTKNPRYNSVVKAPDARTAAKELQAANYATDPEYSNKLIQIISHIEKIAESSSNQLKEISGFKQIAFNYDKN